MGRTTFTTITPLPSSLTRESVLAFLHDHLQMIDLNPLVIERHPIPPPPHALPEEQQCVWYSLTDRISYLPGGIMTGQVTYTCAFHDIPQGLQTHCYAPMGLDIRDRWSVGGSLPGEPSEPVELGLGAPQSGLYLREDVDLRCNVIMASFVKKTMKKSHGSLVETLAQKAHVILQSNSSHDVGSDVRSSHTSTPSSTWMVPQGIPPPRSDTTTTTQPGPLLPVPKAQKSVPTPGPPYHQQHSDQTFGPYGYQTPPEAPASQQNTKAQPDDELFHPQRASQQSFNLEPPSNPRAKTSAEEMAHTEQVSVSPPNPIVQLPGEPKASSREEAPFVELASELKASGRISQEKAPLVELPSESAASGSTPRKEPSIVQLSSEPKASGSTSHEELFHPENTPGNRTSFSLLPPTDPKAEPAPETAKVPEPPIVNPEASNSNDELFHPGTISRLQGNFILRPPSDPRITESPVPLSHSGTVYRGKSRPEHYAEFSSSNPFEETK